MSKSKNKYKSNKSLNNNSMLVRGGFSFETSKWHLLAVIISFHILPLAFFVYGRYGQADIIECVYSVP